MADQQEVTAVKRQHEKEWLTRKEVTSVGIGRVGSQMGIIISVAENPEKIRKEIPNQVDGIPVKIKKTGELRAQ